MLKLIWSLIGALCFPFATYSFVMDVFHYIYPANYLNGIFIILVIAGWGIEGVLASIQKFLEQVNAILENHSSKV